MHMLSGSDSEPKWFTMKMEDFCKLIAKLK